MNRPKRSPSITHTARATMFACMAWVSLCTAVAAQTQEVTTKDLIGTWAGRYASVDTGPFEMTFAQGPDGKLGGSGWARADGQGDMSTWIVKSVRFANGKITIISVDSSGEFDLISEATLESSLLTGTYIVSARADGSEIGGGTFTGTKKPTKGGP